MKNNSTSDFLKDLDRLFGQDFSLTRNSIISLEESENPNTEIFEAYKKAAKEYASAQAAKYAKEANNADYDYNYYDDWSEDYICDLDDLDYDFEDEEFELEIMASIIEDTEEE